MKAMTAEETINRFGGSEAMREKIGEELAGQITSGELISYSNYSSAYRITIGILAAVAIIAMLVPAFLINENDYADTTPSKSTAFSSLISTYKNKEFRTFVFSDILY